MGEIFRPTRDQSSVEYRKAIPPVNEETRHVGSEEMGDSMNEQSDSNQSARDDVKRRVMGEVVCPILEQFGIEYQDVSQPHERRDRG